MLGTKSMESTAIVHPYKVGDSRTNIPVEAETSTIPLSPSQVASSSDEGLETENRTMTLEEVLHGLEAESRTIALEEVLPSCRGLEAENRTMVLEEVSYSGRGAVETEKETVSNSQPCEEMMSIDLGGEKPEMGVGSCQEVTSGGVETQPGGEPVKTEDEDNAADSAQRVYAGEVSGDEKTSEHDPVAESAVDAEDCRMEESAACR